MFISILTSVVDKTPYFSCKNVIFARKEISYVSTLLYLMTIFTDYKVGFNQIHHYSSIRFTFN